MRSGRLLLGACAALLAGAAAPAASVVRLKPADALYVDGKGVGLREPHDVGCGPGSIVVADAGRGRLVVFAVAADGVAAGTEIVRPELPFPVRVDVLPSGSILALDGRSRRIGRVSAAGEFEGWLDPAGAVAIRSFTVGPDGLVYVLDIGRSRVLATDLAGRVQRSIALAADRGGPADVAVDGRGDLFVVDSVRRRVDVARAGATAFSPLPGSLAADVEFPTALVVDADGRLYVVDGNGGGIVILGRDGTFRGRQLAPGWKEGFLRYPGGACALAGTSLVVAERGNHRVQLFAIVP